MGSPPNPNLNPNLNPAAPLRLGLKMRKKPPKNVECAPVRAHLAITTRRYANSLAPRSGERASLPAVALAKAGERGSFPPMVVMPRCAPPVPRALPNRIQSCIIVHNRAIFWQKPVLCLLLPSFRGSSRRRSSIRSWVLPENWQPFPSNTSGIGGMMGLGSHDR